MSAKRFRIVLVEDDASDVELEVRELKRAGLAIEHRVTSTEQQFRAALAEFSPDVILSDFSMPHFDGMTALAIARDVVADTPFIFVSGTLGEDYAIRALKNGATDYVLKTNLVRLPSAVERAIEQAKEGRERRRLRLALEEREAALRRAQLMAKLGHVITRPNGRFESWSDTMVEIVGVRPEDMPLSTRDWLTLIHPDDAEAFRLTAIEAARANGRATIKYRLRRGDGTWIHVRQTMDPLDDEPGAGGARRWFNTVQDVSEQEEAERKIARLNRVYAVLSGINGLIVRASERDELVREACRIAVEAGKFRMAWIGAVDSQAEQVKPIASEGDVRDFFERAPLAIMETKEGGHGLAGRAVRTKKPVISNDTRNDPQRLMRRELEERGISSVAIIPLIVGQGVIGILALYSADVGFFDDEEMRLLLELAGDIAFGLDHIAKAEKLQFLSYYDSLTGLANRALFVDRLEQRLRAAQEAQLPLAVFLVDVERFKAINDAYGRQAGDGLLKQLAERLGRFGGDVTRMARLGTDHFATYLPGPHGEQEIVRLTETRLEQLFGAPYRVGEQELRISGRVGISMSPNDGHDAETLLRNAEAALKKAKTTGERYLFFAPEMTARIHEKLSLESKLRQALEKREFVLHYQPKVALETLEMVGVEALIRWQSPELGLVPPGRFIPLLEETGLILEVGSWALQQASLAHKAWTEEGLRPPRVAVNVSPIQLRRREFVPLVERAIIEGLAPTGIDLEITESLIMENIQANIAKLNAIRELGIQIAVDDFGTGYSSLGYLAKLPVQSLKIDRSFIIAMIQDPNAMTLVQTIISLAHSLKLKVVAEGVETEEQAKFLRLMRCDEMQGYLFSKPIPDAELKALLRTKQTAGLGR